MPREADADEGFGRVRDVDAVRGACVDEAGDGVVDGGEVDDEQRSTVRAREIGCRRTG
jgi:hypothetical protein